MTARIDIADLAGRLRLRKRARSWAGDCPSCRYHSAFSVKTADRTGRPLFYCFNGCTQDQLHQDIQRALGNGWTPPKPVDVAHQAAERERKQAAAAALFNGAAGAVRHDPVGRYLAGRGLVHVVGCPAIRHRPDCPHPEGGRHPAMVALVQDSAGRPIGVHRTYLTPEGRKAAVDPVKASLGPIWGGAIRLDPVVAELVIGEGIETSASAGRLLRLPAWAAISAGNLAGGLVLPPEVRAVVIAVDHDRSGQQAADQAAHRWQAEGRRVRTAMPNLPGQDFNDLLMAQSAPAMTEVHHG